MSLYAMDRARLGELYEALGALGRVYLPTRKNGASAFLPYGEEGGEADLSLLLCDKSPKDLFFPQSEELVKFRLTGAEIALQEAARQKEPSRCSTACFWPSLWTAFTKAAGNTPPSWRSPAPARPKAASARPSASTPQAPMAPATPSPG